MKFVKPAGGHCSNKSVRAWWTWIKLLFPCCLHFLFAVLFTLSRKWLLGLIKHWASVASCHTVLGYFKKFSTRLDISISFCVTKLGTTRYCKWCVGSVKSWGSSPSQVRLGLTYESNCRATWQTMKYRRLEWHNTGLRYEVSLKWLYQHS